MNLKKLLLPIVALVIIIAIVLVFLFSDKYRFRPEPKLPEKQISLETKETVNRTIISSELCKNRLPENLLPVYETIGEFVNKSDSETFYLENISESDFEVAFAAYSADHPEVFWIDTKSAYSYYETGNSLEIDFRFVLTGASLANAKNNLNSALTKVFADVPEKANDLEIEVYINNYLVEHCSYDTKSAMCHTAYGALVNGKAVCDGYAHAFQLLCSKMGIACSIIEGTSDFNDGKEEGHMWNCVKLGDEWYNVDVTWNDISSAQFFCERFFYLNLTDDAILKDHKFSPLFNSSDYYGTTTFNVFQPECKATAFRYLDIYYITITDPKNDNDMIASLIASANKKEKSCSFLIAEALPYSETCTGIINDGYINEWITAANHYCGRNNQIKTETKAYTYKNHNVLTVELNYE